VSRSLKALALVAIVAAGPAGAIAGVAAAERGKFVELAACLGVIAVSISALIIIRVERRRRAMLLPPSRDAHM
jgi:hypothetical protein